MKSETTRLRFGLIAGTLLLVLPLVPTLNLNALNPGDFLHGRYVYLPLAGLSILIAIALHLGARWRQGLLCAAGVIAVVFVPLTWSQEKQWKDDSTVFTIAHQLAPNNRPVIKNLADLRVRAALLIADQGRCNEAMPVFEEVNREFPDDWYTWAGRGICFVQSNNLAQAEDARPISRSIQERWNNGRNCAPTWGYPHWPRRIEQLPSATPGRSPGSTLVHRDDRPGASLSPRGHSPFVDEDGLFADR